MPNWIACVACDSSGVVVCLRCLGIGEDPDEDGKACIDCLGDGEFDCDSCDNVGGWYNE